MKKETVLITGGSGLVGRYLTSLLLSEGFTVSHLSRNHNFTGKVRVFRWNPEMQIADPEVFNGVDYLVHLAGANIGEKRWTAERKKEIVNSRVASAGLMHEVMSRSGARLKAYISASAIGYYGLKSSDKIFSEDDSPGEDFLGNTCRQWEESADLFKSTAGRIVKVRTGVVLERGDSALSRMLKPAKAGLFPQLGNGKQIMPWIHIEDLCNIYLKTIRDSGMEGAYNAVSPQHTTQLEFMRTLAGVMKSTFFHPPVPSVILKIALGEMSSVVLKGSRVSGQKIISAGYTFLFPDLEMALQNILSRTISQ